MPEVDVYTKTLTSGVTDIARPGEDTDFNSSVQDQVGLTKVPMIAPADVINLPKGQAFALLEGGWLWKIRMPLPADTDDPMMPESIQRLALYMRENYRTGETWWSGTSDSSMPVPGGSL